MLAFGDDQNRIYIEWSSNSKNYINEIESQTIKIRKKIFDNLKNKVVTKKEKKTFIYDMIKILEIICTIMENIIIIGPQFSLKMSYFLRCFILEILYSLNLITEIEY